LDGGNVHFIYGVIKRVDKKLDTKFSDISSWEGKKMTKCSKPLLRLQPMGPQLQPLPQVALNR